MDRSKQSHQEHDTDSQLLNRQEVQAQTPEQRPADAAGALQRTRSAPRSGPNPADIKTLQKTVGNRAVQRLLAETPEPSGPAAGAVQRHIAPGTQAEGMSASQSALTSGSAMVTTGGQLAQAAQTLAVASNTVGYTGADMLSTGATMFGVVGQAAAYPVQQEEGQDGGGGRGGGGSGGRSVGPGGP